MIILVGQYLNTRMGHFLAFDLKMIMKKLVMFRLVVEVMGRKNHG